MLRVGRVAIIGKRRYTNPVQVIVLIAALTGIQAPDVTRPRILAAYAVDAERIDKGLFGLIR